MAREFNVPKNIFSGENALIESSSILATFGKKALIVTDEMMVKLKNVEELEKVLNSVGIEYVIYSGINSEPTDKMIVKGKEIYLENKCDFLISIGGGSPIDSMKAIGVIANSNKGISEYMGQEISETMPYMVAIPTTAGTGSEVTQFTIITDTEKDIKMLLKGKNLIPDIAIVDPKFTVSMPKATTAATGLDALCHAVEAYTSRKSQALSDTFAISAVKKIFENLPKVYEDGSNVEARTLMAIASLEAGIAFNNASVTIIHGMSRPIGALYHVPHGLSNAMLMVECLSFARTGAVEKFALLAREISVATTQDSNEEASIKFIDAIKDIVAKLDVKTLEDFGVDKETFMNSIGKMAKDAMASGSPGNTIKEVNEGDVVEIYKRLYK